MDSAVAIFSPILGTFRHIIASSVVCSSAATNAATTEPCYGKTRGNGTTIRVSMFDTLPVRTYYVYTGGVR